MFSQEIPRVIQNAVDRRFEYQLDFTAELAGYPSTRGKEATAQDLLAHAMARRVLKEDR